MLQCFYISYCVHPRVHRTKCSINIPVELNIEPLARYSGIGSYKPIEPVVYIAATSFAFGGKTCTLQAHHACSLETFPPSLFIVTNKY